MKLWHHPRTVTSTLHHHWVTHSRQNNIKFFQLYYIELPLGPRYIFASFFLSLRPAKFNGAAQNWVAFCVISPRKLLAPLTFTSCNAEVVFLSILLVKAIGARSRCYVIADTCTLSYLYSLESRIIGRLSEAHQMSRI